MDQKRFVLCSATALFALTVACSKSPETPVAPSSSSEVTAGAVPSDGSTLKVTAPVPVSPINNAQPDGSIVLVATKAQGKFTSVSPSYEFEVKNSGGAVVYSRVTGGVGSGPDNVEHTVEGGLEFDAPHTWRVRAVIPAVPSGRGRPPRRSAPPPAGTSATTKCSTRSRTAARSARSSDR